MYHLLSLLRKSDQLVIEVLKTSLTEITGLSRFIKEVKQSDLSNICLVK